MTAPSSYYEPLTMEQVAKNWVDTLVQDAETGELNGESAYGMSQFTVVRLTLAGGGPACYVEFGLDVESPEYWFEPNDILYGKLVYMEPFKESVSADLPDDEVWPVFQALTSAPD